MKFRVKMTLCMLAVLSVLFGAGGSLLITGSFRDMLEREKDAAFASYRMVWSALRIVNGLDPYLDAEAISQTMAQLCEQDRAAWTALRLSTETDDLYTVETNLSTYLRQLDPPEPGFCAVHTVEYQDGAHYLILSGVMETNGETLCLQTAHDVSTLYDMRQSQQQTYLRVFGIMALICAVVSYTVSHLLTAPLVGLSRVSRALASGNFHSRVRVRSADEIGTVSEDFNAMAVRLEEMVSQLHQAMERQERFVGSFAHEMKTPMTSLIGYAGLLRDGTLTPEEQDEAVRYIYSEGKRLENLSRKLLDLLVLRRGDMPLVEISPSDLISTLAERLKPLYASKGIQILWQCEEGYCLLEPDLVWSLLLNLADNAQKAMENGGVLRFDLKMLSDGCKIRVLDTGRGIPKESLVHLTEAFYRVDKARSRAQGGFGLGLALCQEITALHTGSIRIDNRPDGKQGTCVIVELRGGRA